MTGALFMLAFGLGTIPGCRRPAFSVGLMIRLAHNQRIRRAAGRGDHRDRLGHPVDRQTEIPHRFTPADAGRGCSSRTPELNNTISGKAANLRCRS